MNHKKRFNRGASYYTTDRYPGRGNCMRKVLEVLDPQQDDVILDLGCGPGIQLIELSHLIKSGYGVDPAEEMIRRANTESTGYTNLHFFVGSAENIPEVNFPGEINKIYSNYALHHLSDQDKRIAISNLTELLPNEGLFILGDLMFSDAPEKHQDLFEFVGYGPGSDTPADIKTIEHIFTSAGLKLSTYILTPLTGVIVGLKTHFVKADRQGRADAAV